MGDRERDRERDREKDRERDRDRDRERDRKIQFLQIEHSYYERWPLRER